MFDLPLARLPEHPTLPENLTYQVNGLIVVFLALGCIWLLLEVTGKVFRTLHRPPESAPAPVAPAPSVAPPAVSSDIPPIVIAAIAAAVHATLGSDHRIAAITPVTPTTDWAREGRRQIFASHQVR